MADPERIEIRSQPGKQTDFLNSVADIVVYGGSAGGGKLLPLDTPIPCPNGWIKNGDLKDGDIIFDEQGKTCRVVKAFPVQTPAAAYRLIFDDGSSIVSGSEHLWLTFNAKELTALTRRDPEWRSKRRSRRPSRSDIGKGQRWQHTPEHRAKLSAAITARNKINTKALPPPTGSIRSTQEIADTLKTVRGRLNHAIPVSKQIEMPIISLPIDPYVLGAWLGDGTANSSGMTGVNEEIFQEIKNAGHEVRQLKHPQSRSIPGLITILKTMNLCGNKHVPPIYLRASASQRLALLQGLMDTNGTVSESGYSQFTNTNKNIVDAVAEIIVSMGWKAHIREGRSMLYGSDCGPVWDVSFTPTEKVFRLKRKSKRQNISKRRTTRFRYITKCEPVIPVPMRCIQVDSPSHLYLAGCQMVPTHNTIGLLFEPLRWIHIPTFAGVIFRRETPQITKEGGLWDTSERFYPLMGGRGIQHNLRWTFKSGATISFAHLQLERDKLNWQGTAIPYIGFDEAPHFTESQVFYMMSRNRSSTGIPGYMRLTCNPDPDSWVARFIAWWIDDKTGFPIPERSGVLRWFIRVNDKLVWADTPEELKANYGPLQMPKSVTFIPAKITDNPILMREDPSYLSNLMAQSQVDRARLLDGNWKVRAGAGMCFKRGWFKVVPFSSVPVTGRTLRYWDRAASLATPENPDPDWTVGLKVRYFEGVFYVMHMERFRDRPYGVKQRIRNLASQDGTRTEVVLEGDPGSAGEFEIDAYLTLLVGYTVKTNRPTKAKYERAKPAMAQAEGGKIVVVEGDWNEDFFAELENFSDDPKEYGHDDVCDALSGAVQMFATATGAFTSTSGIRAGQNQPTTFSLDRLSPSDLGL